MSSSHSDDTLARSYLEAIVQTTDDAIIATDRDSIVVLWNAAAERLFGYSAPEAVGSSISALSPPERGQELQYVWERLRRGERVDRFETTRLHKDGHAIEVSLTIAPIRDRNGEAAGATALVRDITDRRLAEQRLRESEHRYQSIFESTGDAVIINGLRGMW